MQKLTILIPSTNTDNLRNCVEHIKLSSGMTEDEYSIINCAYDNREMGVAKPLAFLVEKADTDIVCFIPEEAVPINGFLANAFGRMQEFEDGFGIVGFNNLVDGNETITQAASAFIGHKKMLPLLDGEFFHEGYYRGYQDLELTERAKALGRFIFAKDAEIEHKLQDVIKPKDDITEWLSRNKLDSKAETLSDEELLKKDRLTYLNRKRDRVGVDLAIGFPMVDEKLHRNFVFSFMDTKKPNHRVLIPELPVGSFLHDIAAARNAIVNQAIVYGCTHLIMMDTDQIYPDDVVTKLLSHDIPMVGTAVHRRWPPFDRILLRGTQGRYKHVPDEECFSGDLVDVDATGTGCICLDMRVFNDVQYPWFSISKTEEGKPVGEDICFCGKLKAAGHRIAVDTSIEIGHITSMSIDKSFYKLYKKVKGLDWKP